MSSVVQTLLVEREDSWDSGDQWNLQARVATREGAVRSYVRRDNVGARSKLLHPGIKSGYMQIATKRSAPK